MTRIRPVLELAPLPDLHLRRRGAVPARAVGLSRAARRQRPPLYLGDLDPLTTRRRSVDASARRTAMLAPTEAIDAEASLQSARSVAAATSSFAAVANIELHLDRCPGVQPLGGSDALNGPLSAVAVALVAAVRSTASLDTAPIDLVVDLLDGAPRTLTDADRLTVATCRDLFRRVDDPSALRGGAVAPLRAASHLIGLTASAQWKVDSLACPLPTGQLMTLDLGNPARAVVCSVSDDGSEAIALRTTATATLVFSTRALTPAAATRLLAHLKDLVHDEVWMRRQTSSVSDQLSPGEDRR